MKLTIKTNMIILIASIIIAIALNMVNTTSTGTVKKSISDKILRLHVIANSDSAMDQEIKLKVRDAVVDYLANCFDKVDNKSNAIEIIHQEVPALKALVHTVLEENGFSYGATFSCERKYFPVKVYNEYTFPEGDYDSFCIELGNSSGKNWWCVLYPPMCLLEASTTVTTSGSFRDSISSVLDGDEIDLLTNSTFRFKYLTFLNFIFN